jgi:hypothetical protein
VGVNSRDQLLKSVGMFFFVSVEIFKIETFESRLSCAKIVEICQDLSAFFEIFY